MTGTLVKLVAMFVLAAPGSGNLASAATPTITLPPQVQIGTVICNPAWGTIVLPICI